MTSGLATSLPIAAAIRCCAADISLAIDSEIALSVAASVFTPLDRLAMSRMLARTASILGTAALALAALILYVPANIYPVLKMYMYGAYSENTVWEGIVALMQNDEWLVAFVVFMASMVIPLVKLAGLFSLVVTARMGWAKRLRGRTQLYKFIDAVGPWAMLDVFLLAVLVALVKLNTLAKVIPGPGLLAFTLMWS